MADVGEVVPLGIVVRDVDAARTPMNATTVALRLTRPDDGTVVTVTVGNPPVVTGYYSADIIPDAPGLWRYEWKTTDPSLVLEGSFNADPPWPYGLISLAETKRLLRIDPAEDAHDEDLRQVILSATRAAEDVCGEVIARRTVVETHHVRAPAWRLVLAQRPVIALATVNPIIPIDPVAAAGYLPPVYDMDEFGILTCTYGGPFLGSLRITYDAGYIVVPHNYREAVLYIVQHLWQNRGGASRIPRVGGTEGVDQGGLAYSIPNRARDLLGRAGPLVG